MQPSNLGPGITVAKPKKPRGQKQHPSMQDLITILEKHNRDIEHIKALTSIASSEDWIKRNKKTGWTAEMFDHDGLPETEPLVTVRRSNGAIHAVEGYVTKEPTRRKLFREYFGENPVPAARKINKWNEFLGMKKVVKPKSHFADYKESVIKPVLANYGTTTKSPGYISLSSKVASFMWKFHYSAIIVEMQGESVPQMYDWMVDSNGYLKKHKKIINDQWPTFKNSYITQFTGAPTTDPAYTRFSSTFTTALNRAKREVEDQIQQKKALERGSQFRQYGLGGLLRGADDAYAYDAYADNADDADADEAMDVEFK